jgi:hypothetical protein
MSNQSRQILEQVEGGDLIVNRGDETRPKGAESEKRDFNTVEGLDAAIKLAQVSVIITQFSR